MSELNKKMTGIITVYVAARGGNPVANSYQDKVNQFIVTGLLSDQAKTDEEVLKQLEVIDKVSLSQKPD